MKNKCKKNSSVMTAMCCAIMLVCNVDAYAQKSSSVNPVKTSILPNVGWRDVKSDMEKPFDVNDPNWPQLDTNVRVNDLISVCPNSFCVVSNFGRKSNRGMMTFVLEVKLQKGSSLLFNADKNVRLTLDGATYKALPSSKMNLIPGKSLKGEVNIPIRKSLKGRRTATLLIQVGDDLHRFELAGSGGGRTQELALVPYNPTWMASEKKKNENLETRQRVEEVKKAVKKAEDVTKDIKDDLKEMLATAIALLRANNQLTENTKVDVNAEVMPEVRKDGAVEYNMKVRYDVQVVSDYVKKMNISQATEDWPAGKYRLKDSQAALQTAGIIKTTVERIAALFCT